MVEIPENPTPRNFDAEVDGAVKAVLKGLSRPNSQSGGLSVNHGRMYEHVMTDVAAKVAELFKAKGYHAHYCRALDGTPHTLEITTYPTNHDI